ncbi:hypothetical protein [Colwellia psychrerythraea]|uniref:Uncharacterized protein n=1 Tax=Colwellia psychrerythraea TaxID=28229 RepID=A0A099KD86_COLPS|nr:hypothetical protein [Colwellia psychrerythraea]KGJ87992.1 hypothetical protein ND2E_4266 [Colwellia psychrerythraea]
MNQGDYKVDRASNDYPKFESQFNEFLSNPEHKLSEIKGVSVLPSDSHNLRIEALGKEIEIRLGLVLNGESNLGQVTAYLIKSRDDVFISEKPILALWLDVLGNVKTETPESAGFTSVKDANSLINFIYDTLNKLLESDECTPFKNG